MKRRSIVSLLIATCCIIPLLTGTATAAAKKKVAKIKVTSDSLTDGGTLPAVFSCDVATSPYPGGNSPALSWSKPPKTAKSIIILLVDPDAPGGTFYHWGLYNIPVKTRTIAAGATIGAVAAPDIQKNDAAYFGPCVPPGETHHYVFRVVALDKKIKLSGGGDDPWASDIGDVLATAYKKHIVGSGTLTVTYSGDQITQAGCLQRGGIWRCTGGVCSCQ